MTKLRICCISEFDFRDIVHGVESSLLPLVWIDTSSVDRFFNCISSTCIVVLKKTVPQNEVTITFEALKIMSQNFGCIFQTNVNLN